MKLKNITAVISFLIIAVSCSTEDDVLNEITNGSVDNAQKEVCFNLSSGSILTRAGSSELTNGTESGEVKYCSIVIVNAETESVVTAKDKVAVTDDGTLDTKFFVKTGVKYNIYVIGDAVTSFIGCTTEDDVKNAVLNESDLENLVTYAVVEEVSYSESDGFPTMSEAADDPKEVNFTLQHLTAQVRLKEVTLNGFASGAAADVALTKVELLNRVVERDLFIDYTTYTTIGATATDTRAFTNDTILVEGVIKEMNTDFTTFPNPKAVKAPVAMKLTFKVGDSEELQERTYVINRTSADEEPKTDFTNGSGHTYIAAGNIYELYVKVSLKGEEVFCAVKCVVKDWQYNEYEIELIEKPQQQS